MKRVEFPSGSGRLATYTPEEIAVMKSVLAAAEAAHAPRASQLAVLHEAKLMFGISLDETVELDAPKPGDIVIP